MSDRIETFVGTRLLRTDEAESKPMGLVVADGQMKIIFSQPVAWIGINRLTARAGGTAAALCGDRDVRAS